MNKEQKNLPQEYLQFISEVTLEEFLKAGEYVKGKYYPVSGGIFSIYQGIAE